MSISVSNFIRHTFSTIYVESPKKLFKYLMRQCEKLPKGAEEHYKFQIKQSFKQHINETDPERIKQIMKRSYDDTEWILKKKGEKLSMYQVPLATSSSSVPRKTFWDCVSIYHNRPHLVNRKITAAKQILFYAVDSSFKCVNITDVLSCHALAYEIRKLQEVTSDNITIELLDNLFDKSVKFDKCSMEDLAEKDEIVLLSVRMILPRAKNANRCVELVVIDKKKDMLTFFSASIEQNKVIPIPSFGYRIELTNEGLLRITVNDFEDADTSSAEWLQDVLFSKIMKWTSGSSDNIGIQSLSCVSSEKYYNLYSELKNKYGEPLRKIWKEKAKTDPQKFIFEDIAIASYLICIWDGQNVDAKNHVKFVDCGCGNGLLVYILNLAGFSGYGIDIRKRNIWDIFSENSDLRVGAVEPCSIYPDATWLIGNHSDELTPWLPVIALRSSPNTNFFVLPCCPFDLNGKKFIRKNTGLSQYADYLEHIKNISEICKFDISVDKLRIPSTKRICLIGNRKTVDDEHMSQAKKNIDNFICSRFGCEKYIFKQRSSIEKARNCTQIDRTVIHEIVKNVVNILLMNEVCLIKYNGSRWNKGRQIHLGDLSKKLPKNYLSNLRKECGGLQTLLRNHRYLFKIESAQVSLREPYTIEETSKYRDKPCWFYRYHPNGCLYDSAICGYKHSTK